MYRSVIKIHLALLTDLTAHFNSSSLRKDPLQKNPELENENQHKIQHKKVFSKSNSDEAIMQV